MFVCYPGVTEILTILLLGSSYEPQTMFMKFNSLTNRTKFTQITGSPVAQSVANSTADSGIASSISARSHTFVEIVHEIISTVIFLPLNYKRKFEH